MGSLLAASPFFTLGVGIKVHNYRSELKPDRIVRVFPRRTSHTPKDDMAFVGDPPMFRPDAEEVHISVAFTWDIPAAERLQMAWAQYYPRVLIGGPAVGNPDGPFVAGQYVKEGVTFTTRGCNWKCPWCLVPKMEGVLQVRQDFPDGYIVQDNNLLQAPKDHLERVFAMLDRQPRAMVLAGGIQSSLVDEWFADQLRERRVNQIFMAADTKTASKPLARAVGLLEFLGRKRIRSYVLIGFKGESLAEARDRLETVWEIGAMPFAQLYQPPDSHIEYGPEWRALQRRWCRPAAMMANSSRLEQEVLLL